MCVHIYACKTIIINAKQAMNLKDSNKRSYVRVWREKREGKWCNDIAISKIIKRNKTQQNIKHPKHKLRELMVEIDKSTIVIWDFHILSKTSDRITGQKTSKHAESYHLTLGKSVWNQTISNFTPNDEKPSVSKIRQKTKKKSTSVFSVSVMSI